MVVRARPSGLFLCLLPTCGSLLAPHATRAGWVGAERVAWAACGPDRARRARGVSYLGCPAARQHSSCPLAPPGPLPYPAVVAKLPALQSVMVPHNKLGGSLACSLLASGKLAALDVTGGWRQ